MGYLNAMQGTGLMWDIPLSEDEGGQAPVGRQQAPVSRQPARPQQQAPLTNSEYNNIIRQQQNQNAMAREAEQAQVPNSAVQKAAIMGNTNYALIDVCALYPFLPQCEKMPFGIEGNS